jgi:hypothetical protein
VFETAASDGSKCSLIHFFDGEMRERDEGTKDEKKERKKERKKKERKKERKSVKVESMKEIIPRRSSRWYFKTVICFGDRDISVSIVVRL